MDELKEFLSLKTQNKACVLATVVRALGSTPREAGAKMVVRADSTIYGTIGGGAIEQLVVSHALKIINTAETEYLHCDLSELGMSCGGEMDIFLQASGCQPMLYIFGAGHIGSFLSGIGKKLGFFVTVVDNRREFANRERLPLADRIFAEDYKQVLPSLSFHKDSYIVIVTHGHLHDQDILEYCIHQPFQYMGMIGSRQKVKSALERLKKMGVKPALLSKIYSPIGIDIGAQTPEEIAIAICAELVAVKNDQLKTQFRPLSLTIRS